METYTTPESGLLKYANGSISVGTAPELARVTPGDRIPQGTTLHLGEGTEFILQLDNGDEISSTQIANQAPNQSITAQPADLDEIEALQQQILAGADPTQSLPETVAGQSARQGSGGFTNIDRSGAETLANAGHDTQGLSRSQLNIAEPEQDPSVLNSQLTLTINAPDQSSDTTPIITGNTNAPPGSIIVLIVTDANGDEQTIEIIVGPGGDFSIEVPTPLPDGGYTVGGTVTDPNNNTGNGNDDGSIDTTPPLPPSI